MSDTEQTAQDRDDHDDGPLDPQTQRALDFVDMLLEKMDMDAEVTLAPDDGEGSADEIRLEIEGPDAGRVIGKRGSVLEAIQYLTTRVAHKPGEPRKHIAVDAEGYRARHEDQLGEMAKKLARRVAKEGKVITFDPMSARDRRVVHMALKDIPEVRTESHGEGPDRRVQIIPVKGGAGPASSGGAPTSRGGDRDRGD
ncbi:MAG: KH domain-containing protein [Deltaproteobacteria bacterium]|nr:KH domain-containing protein [Deltaproteobacteria bacterium]